MERNPQTPYKQFKIWILAWVGIADCVSIIVTLGYRRTCWRSHLLATDWFDMSLSEWVQSLWKQVWISGRQ
jgi:hypothetical protein